MYYYFINIIFIKTNSEHDNKDSWGFFGEVNKSMHESTKDYL